MAKNQGEIKAEVKGKKKQKDKNGAAGTKLVA